MDPTKGLEGRMLGQGWDADKVMKDAEKLKRLPETGPPAPDELEPRVRGRRARWRADPSVAAFLASRLALPGISEWLLAALEDAGERALLDQVVELRGHAQWLLICAASRCAEADLVHEVRAMVASTTSGPDSTTGRSA